MTEDVKQSRPKESHQLTDVYFGPEKGGRRGKGAGLSLDIQHCYLPACQQVFQAIFFYIFQKNLVKKYKVVFHGHGRQFKQIIRMLF
jgi:hypothetical protein